MNKSELKTLWGSYTDTDKLVDDIMALLTQYRHINSEHGVCTMLNEYFVNKQPLIELMIKSENYSGDLRIILNKDFDRQNTGRDISNFCATFLDRTNARSMICTKVDNDGKTIKDYLKVGKKILSTDDLLNPKKIATLHPMEKHLKKFYDNGETVESVKKFKDLHSSICTFSRITAANLSEQNANSLNELAPGLKLAAGLKTSRAFNRLCGKYGVDKAPTYNKLFAEYSDMVSGLKRKLDYIISLNPYDYLTMSFGKSWASCQTIDKTNRRGMPNHYSGAYCGGTLSYMLDRVSIIVYVVDKGANPQTADKLYRNMFHYGNNVLIQGRIYPQGNDGATDLYKVFRQHIQDEFASLLNLEGNNWTKSNDRPSEYIAGSLGSHYRDYDNFDSCNVTYPTERKDNRGNIIIGHYSICTNCGAEHRSAEHLTCGACRNRY